jgi:hypothetical protein
MIEAAAFLAWAVLLVAAGEAWDRRVARRHDQAHPVRRRRGY